MATATITAGQSLSSAVAVPEGHVVSGVKIPAAWTAASVTFQGGVDSTALGDLYNTAGEVTFLSGGDAAGKYLVCSPLDFGGVRFLKVRSGTSGAAVNQVANRSIDVSFRPIH